MLWDEDDDWDPQSWVGDVHDVRFADGVTRRLAIGEVDEPGLFSRVFGTGIAKIYSEDGRELGFGYDGVGCFEKGAR